MRYFYVLLALVFPMFGVFLVANIVQAQTEIVLSGGTNFVVNAVQDEVDESPGDGVCETGVGNGICTLRAAIQESNALPGADSITLPAGLYGLSIVGSDPSAAAGDLNITETLTINGAGSDVTIVDGNDIDRIFDVRMAPGNQVIISDLTIEDGNSLEEGGGICHCASGTMLQLTRVVLRDNFAAKGGGGLYNAGELLLSDSLIEGNFSHSTGGLANLGTAVISHSTIISNIAASNGLGGGIFNLGILTLVNSLVADNQALTFFMGTNGGGIFNYTGADLTIHNSTIRDNVADNGYGGLANFGGVAELVNVTISGNEGGMMQSDDGMMMITNTTIVSNIHSSPIIVSFRVDSGLVTLKNTIIAGSDANSNCFGIFTSLGHNLESGQSCGFNASGDIENTDPLVGVLQDNGGATWTHALLVNSPAIDAGDEVGCPSIDQRGFVRPLGDGCDIGSYELQGLGPTAVDDVATTAENAAVLIDVLANDTAGTNGTTEIIGVGDPMSGTAVISGTQILYTPSHHVTGTDVFTYTISDMVLTDTATVTVTIKPNQPSYFWLYMPIVLKPDA